MKKTYKSNLILLFLSSILTLYLVNSNLIVNAVLEYTKLFITKLFPTSFLIYIISSLLINYGLIDFLSKITKNPTIIYITLMSMISGFPSGSKYTKELYEKKYIDESTSNYLLTYTHFPNPLFILGPVASLINNSAYTNKLLISLYLSNIFLAIIFRKNITNQSIPIEKQESFSKCLSNAILSSLKILILVYGTSIFFYLISLILTTYINTSPIFYILINGFFDLTKGIFSTPLLESTLIKSIIIMLFISLGSISIHIQIKSILSDTSLKYKNFLFGRIISSILSLIIFIVLINFKN